MEGSHPKTWIIKEGHANEASGLFRYISAKHSANADMQHYVMVLLTEWSAAGSSLSQTAIRASDGIFSSLAHEPTQFIFRLVPQPSTISDKKDDFSTA